jgi:FMN phosphatase YigB (HAD superfamily)
MIDRFNEPASAVSLVVFDAGGVILRVVGPWDVVQRRAGVPSDERTQTEAFQALQRAAADEHQRGEIDTETYLARVSEAGGLTVRQVEQILEGWIADEYPGWNDVLDRLGQSGVETALLSNTNAFHGEFMAPLGSRAGRYPAIGRLRHQFASHRFGMMKPDPAIYRAVETATGHAGSSILFFDDLPENVAAAQAVGWRAVLIDPTGDPAAQVLAALDAVGL